MTRKDDQDFALVLIRSYKKLTHEQCIAVMGPGPHFGFNDELLAHTAIPFEGLWMVALHVEAGKNAKPIQFELVIQDLYGKVMERDPYGLRTFPPPRSEVVAFSVPWGHGGKKVLPFKSFISYYDLQPKTLHDVWLEQGIMRIRSQNLHMKDLAPQTAKLMSEVMKKANADPSQYEVEFGKRHISRYELHIRDKAIRELEEANRKSSDDLNAKMEMYVCKGLVIEDIKYAKVEWEVCLEERVQSVIKVQEIESEVVEEVSVVAQEQLIEYSNIEVYKVPMVAGTSVVEQPRIDDVQIQALVEPEISETTVHLEPRPVMVDANPVVKYAELMMVTALVVEEVFDKCEYIQECMDPKVATETDYLDKAVRMHPEVVQIKHEIAMAITAVVKHSFDECKLIQENVVFEIAEYKIQLENVEKAKYKIQLENVEMIHPKEIQEKQDIVMVPTVQAAQFDECHVLEEMVVPMVLDSIHPESLEIVVPSAIQVGWADVRMAEMMTKQGMKEYQDRSFEDKEPEAAGEIIHPKASKMKRFRKYVRNHTRSFFRRFSCGRNVPTDD